MYRSIPIHPIPNTRPQRAPTAPDGDPSAPGGRTHQLVVADGHVGHLAPAHGHHVEAAVGLPAVDPQRVGGPGVQAATVRVEDDAPGGGREDHTQTEPPNQSPHSDTATEPVTTLRHSHQTSHHTQTTATEPVTTQTQPPNQSPHSDTATKPVTTFRPQPPNQSPHSDHSHQTSHHTHQTSPHTQTQSPNQSPHSHLLHFNFQLKSPSCETGKGS